MKQPTLDQIWIRCIKMWTWIVAKKPADAFEVLLLKREYARRYCRTIRPGAYANCWFCYWAHTHGRDCRDCPGVQVDLEFVCSQPEYDYLTSPTAFLRKIRSLNCRRLAAKARAKARQSRGHIPTVRVVKP